jgi:CRP-like cAMP-binding protein
MVETNKRKRPSRDFLKTVPMLAHASSETLHILEHRLHALKEQRGVNIIGQDWDGPPSLYIVQSGRIAVFRDDVKLHREMTENPFLQAEPETLASRKVPELQPFLIDILRTGHVFGELSVIDSEKRSATCQTLDPCCLLKLDQQLFNQLIETDIGFVRGVLSHLTTRLRRFDDHVTKLALIDRHRNVAYAICQLALRPEMDFTVDIPVRAISHYCGATNEYVKDYLDKFAKAGWVDRQGDSRLMVLDIDALLDYALWDARLPDNT